jgi:hypothetical protein
MLIDSLTLLSVCVCLCQWCPLQVLEVDDNITLGMQQASDAADMPHAGPDALHAVRKAAIAKLAIALASACPLLEAHPELLTPPCNVPPRAPTPSQPAPAVVIARRMIADFAPASSTERVQLVALEAAVDEEVALHASLMKMCMQHPKTPLGASVHGNMHGAAPSWEHLRDAVVTASSSVDSNANVSGCSSGLNGTAATTAHVVTPEGSNASNRSSLSHRASHDDSGEGTASGRASPPLVAPEVSNSSCTNLLSC